jgi:hypothetical protein
LPFVSPTTQSRRRQYAASRSAAPSTTIWW